MPRWRGTGGWNVDGEKGRVYPEMDGDTPSEPELVMLPHAVGSIARAGQEVAGQEVAPGLEIKRHVV